MADQMRLGTFGYMSPEQRRGGEVTERSDVYSLGAVLAYASTHKPPPDPVQPGERSPLPDLPPGLRPLVACCLQAEPRNRADLSRVIADCGRPADAGRGGWLPQNVEAFVRTRVLQQQGKVTTLLERMKARDKDGGKASGRARAIVGGQAPPARAAALSAWRAFRARCASLAASSRRWPLLSEASLRRWTWACLATSTVTLAEVVSRTTQVESRPPGSPHWLTIAQSVRAAIEPFTSWLPDPIATWSAAAGSAAGVDRRLAAISLVLAGLATFARRAPRAKLYQAAIKATATYAGAALVIGLWLRLAQTGLDPLIHTAEYLRWWAFLAFAVAAAIVFPAAGRTR